MYFSVILIEDCVSATRTVKACSAAVLQCLSGAVVQCYTAGSGVCWREIPRDKDMRVARTGGAGGAGLQSADTNIISPLSSPLPDQNCNQKTV